MPTKSLGTLVLYGQLGLRQSPQRGHSRQQISPGFLTSSLIWLKSSTQRPRRESDRMESLYLGRCKRQAKQMLAPSLLNGSCLPSPVWQRSRRALKNNQEQARQSAWREILYYVVGASISGLVSCSCLPPPYYIPNDILWSNLLQICTRLPPGPKNHSSHRAKSKPALFRKCPTVHFSSPPVAAAMSSSGGGG